MSWSKIDKIHEENYQSQQFWAMVMCSFGKEAKVGLRIWDLPNLKEIDNWYGSIYTIVIQHRVEKKYLNHFRKVKTNNDGHGEIFYLKKVIGMQPWVV